MIIDGYSLIGIITAIFVANYVGHIAAAFNRIASALENRR